MKTLRCVETSGSDHPVTQRRISEERLLQKYSCENFKPNTSGLVSRFLIPKEKKRNMSHFKWKFRFGRIGYVQMRTSIFVVRSHIYEHIQRTTSWPSTFAVLEVLVFCIVSVLPWTLLFNIINILPHVGHLAFCLHARQNFPGVGCVVQVRT